MASALKGFAVSRTFAYVAMLIILTFLIAVFLLIHFGAMDYLIQNINSQTTLCETFESQPLFGSIRCPS